ncbi:aspartic-type endopeptidase [Niveomyces insectorum RCEF 264]|uniref:Aspartic-type endopeptidase n=1 Tax=Niveomyces insectorum RCEF 264 TaxID=1081102 RepID=A0A167YLL2_9HYPO|nr:aspartic-type endopeptidase [Niveomyces insectorum RCEF 264]
MPSKLVFLQLLLWISAAQAFFPWFPPWVCSEDDELCKSQVAAGAATAAAGSTPAERALPALAAPEAPLRLKLARRPPAARQAPPHNEPLKARVARIADRLAKKHASAGRAPPSFNGRRHARPASPTDHYGGVAKRTNTFPIAAAATPTATNAVGIDQDGTDFSYFVQAQFGAGKTPLYMLLDTGAGTTWVMGTDCASPACGMHNTFGAAQSKTLKTSDDTFSIAYGSGTVSGSLASDTVTVGAVSLALSFGLANTTSDDFTHFPFDGILGLSLSEGVTDNFWQTVKKDQALPANIFGVSLWRETGNDDGGVNTGEIVFGATDPSQYTGSIGYTPVASAAGGDWAVPLDDIGYNGGKAGVTGRLAYIDTGTTYVFGPPADVAALHKQIPGASSSDGITYTVPCGDGDGGGFDDLPPLTVYFSGVAYNMSAADWLSPPASSGGSCTSNVYGHAVVSDAWLLGDTFIKNVYAVFDADQSRIGFAEKPAIVASASQASPSASSTTKPDGVAGSAASGVSAAPSGAATTTTPATGLGGTTSGGALPGLSGHETSATALAEATSAPKAAATSSPADQLEGSIYVSVVCVVAAIAMAV